MKLFNKRFVTVLLAATVAVTAAGQQRVLRGFDGGMMLHTGYLWGAVEPLGQDVSGAPMGIGCDFIVSEAFHLTLKADWLNAISK
ncbi:MAG: hypothetical protein MJY56_00925 [Bacteroidales bacterium]|nr:hypothetical protein [Bacteroidales bacterium]